MIKQIYITKVWKSADSYVLTLDSNVKNNLQIEEKDLIRVSIEVVKKAFKCNHCDGVCYVNIEENFIDDLELVCEECKTTQTLGDSISYEEWKNVTN